jgi:hypothetical protein
MRWQDTRVKFIQLEKGKDTILSRSGKDNKIERLILYYLGCITLIQGKKSRSGGVQAPHIPLSNKINTYCGRIIFPSIFLLCSFSYTLMVILNQEDQGNQPSFQCE